jgi:phosphopantetheinyl transferase (holo-ACP synthase)
LRGNEGIRSDIEIAHADGTVWMRLKGWADRRFDPPPRFHRAWIAPREAMMAEPVDILNHAGSFECCRLELLFDPGASLWKDLWASLVLSRQERKDFAERKRPEHLQIEWLTARTAAKDAMRSFLRKHHGLELLPADIEITEDHYGRPIANGLWKQQLHAVPELSMAYADGLAVAVAGDGSFAIEIQALQKTAATDLANEDRLGCAKKVAQKVLGRSRILAIDAPTGVVEAVSETSGEKVAVHTAREGAHVIAIARNEKRTA